MSRSAVHARGLLARTSGALGGALIAGALIVGMQVPLLEQPAVASVPEIPAATTASPLAWPSVGSAALSIPSLGVRQSVRDAVVPIASLTKMMTAIVVLEHLPLSANEVGPCHTVSAADVATYQYMISTDQSNVPVVAGEQICELQLLQGLLVHSADNYAAMLADLVAGSQSAFVAMMNQTAASMGLRQTHYADASGFDSASVSSALDQARVAQRLMSSALVRSIVDQSSVVLPVGGSEFSYTPYVGTQNVIGVKSGRTSEAGGCDVLAMTFAQGSSTRVIYAVVLGQRGGNLIGPAGAAALALARSALAHVRTLSIHRGQVMGHVGWARSRTSLLAETALSLSWWGPSGEPSLRVHLGDASDIRARRKVGELVISGPVSARVGLLAAGRASPPTIWQRLR